MLQPINDTNLELDPGWKIHLPNDGSLIGGVQPTSANLLQGLPGQPQELVLYEQGPAYGTVEGYLWRPSFITLGLPYVTFCYRILIGCKMAATQQVIETDLIHIVRMPDGTVMKLDGSFQVNIMEGWMLQDDTSSTATWMDTGIKLPPPAPDVPHLVEIRQFCDVPNKRLVMLSYSIDGIVYPIPAQFQNIPATISGWLEVVNQVAVQLQITSNATAGTTAEAFDLVSIVHSATKTP